MRPLRLGMVCTDGREMLREYGVPLPMFGTAPEALLQGLALLPEVEVHVLSCTQKPVQAPPKLADNTWFHSLLVPKIGWLRTGYQGCIRAVRRKLRELQPDIVHGQGTERECAISAVLSGFPNVLTIHGNMRLIAEVNHPRPLTYGWLAARLEALTLPRSDGVVCITRYTQEAVSDLARRTWVVPNAVHGSFFEVEPAPVQPPVILFVGNISVRKNQNAFIRALDGLAAKAAFSVVFLGGTGEGDPYAREFFGLIESRPWCRFGGFADRQQLRQHLRETTLLVLPSLEDNCPMCVLEAMAAGVPVMASKVGGVPDLIEDGVTGLFCDPLEPSTFAAGIARFLGEPGLSGELARKARERARQVFRPEMIARRHLEIYREVLSAPR